MRGAARKQVPDEKYLCNLWVMHWVVSQGSGGRSTARAFWPFRSRKWSVLNVRHFSWGKAYVLEVTENVSARCKMWNMIFLAKWVTRHKFCSSLLEICRAQFVFSEVTKWSRRASHNSLTPQSLFSTCPHIAVIITIIANSDIVLSCATSQLERDDWAAKLFRVDRARCS